MDNILIYELKKIAQARDIFNEILIDQHYEDEEYENIEDIPFSNIPIIFKTLLNENQIGTCFSVSNEILNIIIENLNTKFGANIPTDEIDPKEKATIINTYINNKLESIDSKYTLRLITKGNGTITQSGTGIYNKGDIVTITAIPNDGNDFVKWNDGDQNTEKSFQILSNTLYEATFKPKTYNVTLTLKYYDGGNKETIKIIEKINHGNKLTLSDIPNINGNIPNQTDVDSILSTTITKDTTFTLNYTPNNYIATLVYKNGSKKASYNGYYGDNISLESFKISENDLIVDGFDYILPTFDKLTKNVQYPVKYVEPTYKFKFITVDDISDAKDIKTYKGFNENIILKENELKELSFILIPEKTSVAIKAAYTDNNNQDKEMDFIKTDDITFKGYITYLCKIIPTPKTLKTIIQITK